MYFYIVEKLFQGTVKTYYGQNLFVLPSQIKVSRLKTGEVLHTNLSHQTKFPFSHFILFFLVS